MQKRGDKPYPVGTVIRLKKNNLFAMVREQMCLTDGAFYYYLIEIEDREGLYAHFPYNNDDEVECYPEVDKQ
jgi:hypothetical protein